jgi:malate dehydrogenase
MRKISVFGAGRVGESTAQILANQELCQEVVLIDVVEGMARGTALDIQESAPLFGFDVKVGGDVKGEAIADSDAVIITAGLPRKPGMSRSDVLDANAKIVGGIIDTVMDFAPNATILMVTNPVDVMTYLAWKKTGWSRNRIIGLSGVLDAARMASFIAMETGYSIKDITTMVLGGHGDSMVPMARFTTINGIPIEYLMDKETVTRIEERTRNGGAEILALKKTSSANDSPAAAVAVMVDAIRHNRRRILPCVAILDGEYGQRDVAVGVPAVLSGKGMETVIELPLTEEETRMFAGSVAQVRADLAHLF